MSSKTKLVNWVRETIPPIIAFLVLDLTLTVIFFEITGTSVHIGTLRPINTIPLKGAELIGAGLGVGILASLTNRGVDLSMITLGLVFVVLLDLDHLPSAFGLSQPIRPAHSLAFLALLIITLSFTIKKQPWVELIAVSSFFAHIASDTGVFAFLAPFSFQYMSLDAYRIPFAAISVVFALTAGYVKYKKRTTSISNSIMINGVVRKT